MTGRQTNRFRHYCCEREYVWDPKNITRSHWNNFSCIMWKRPTQKFYSVKMWIILIIAQPSKVLFSLIQFLSLWCFSYFSCPMRRYQKLLQLPLMRFRKVFLWIVILLRRDFIRSERRAYLELFLVHKTE